MKPQNKFLSLANWDWRLLVSVLLILSSALGLYVLSHGSPMIPRKNLTEFPQAIGVWEAVEVPIEDRVQALLGASDLLSRVYLDRQDRTSIGMFVAFFASQRKGGAIHSPKNCLPGAGWSALKGDVIPIVIPGYSKPVRVNRYIIQKGLDKQVVLYWYQSQGRIIASEYSAKFCLLWDAITKNRTDGALVRIVTPVGDGEEGAALARATTFVQQVFRPLENYLPN